MGSTANRILWAAVLMGVALSMLWLSWPTSLAPQRVSVHTVFLPERSGEALLPLPPLPALSPDKVALGKSLFLELRLSRDNSISCASCHDLNVAGSDSKRFSVGVAGAQGTVNAPSVFNASLNFVQFWDGRAGSLEEQAAGPVHNPIEMASNWDEVIAKLSGDERYRRVFQRLYPQGITAAAIVDAIATFERALLTSNAPFDRFLRGDAQAIDSQAQQGYRHFKEFGCASCHQGANIGGNLFQRFGVMGDYFADRASIRPISAADLGRFNVTGQEDDRYVFKVPSLRNVALTAPYFHDGGVETLDEAVTIMARYQLGRELSKAEVQSIVAFLKTLTGERPVVP
jgi:cytochrome c peroxidase